MHFKWAILSVLAKYPDGHARLDEIEREVEAITSPEDPLEQISCAVDDIDIFQSGLVIPEGDGLRITDSGRSALKAMERSSKPSLNRPPSTSSHSLTCIDDRTGVEERPKTFALELRQPDEHVDFSSVHEEPGPRRMATETPAAARERCDEDLSDNLALQSALEGDHADFEIGEMVVTNARETESRDAPTFLTHSFGSRLPLSEQRPTRRFGLASSIASCISSAARLWRGHLQQDLARARPPWNPRGGLFALLTLLFFVICAGAVMALVQIKSLKSEIGGLQRELLSLKEHLAKAEAEERAKRDTDLQKEAQAKTSAGKSRASPDDRVEQAPLSLTREEAQLVRDYIKPAPLSTRAATSMNVGDSVSGGTISLPSPLTDKIPKLLGARFAIRNGAIIILKRDSHQADAVLAPN